MKNRDWVGILFAVLILLGVCVLLAWRDSLLTDECESKGGHVVKGWSSNGSQISWCESAK